MDGTIGRASSGTRDDTATVTARQLHDLVERLITAGQ